MTDHASYVTAWDTGIYLLNVEGSVIAWRVPPEGPAFKARIPQGAPVLAVERKSPLIASTGMDYLRTRHTNEVTFTVMQGDVIVDVPVGGVVVYFPAGLDAIDHLARIVMDGSPVVVAILVKDRRAPGGSVTRPRVDPEIVALVSADIDSSLMGIYRHAPNCKELQANDMADAIGGAGEAADDFHALCSRLKSQLGATHILTAEYSEENVTESPDVTRKIAYRLMALEGERTLTTSMTIRR